MSIISIIAASVFFAFFGSFAVIAIGDGKYPFSFFLILFGSIPAFLLWLESKRAAAQRELPEWLEKNREKICEGQARYRGIRVTPGTRLVRYQGCVSVVAASFRFYSPWYVEKHEGSAKTFYCLATFLFGWWGLPWGPIFTLQCLHKNLNGGETALLGEFI